MLKKVWDCFFKPCWILTDIFWVLIKRTYPSKSSIVLFWLLQLSPQSYRSVQGRLDFLLLQILFLHRFVHPHLRRTRQISGEGRTKLWMQLSILFNPRKICCQRNIGTRHGWLFLNQDMVVCPFCMGYQCTRCWWQLLSFFAELVE